jgi:acetyl-CoA C-acetyltransferase
MQSVTAGAGNFAANLAHLLLYLPTSLACLREIGFAEDVVKIEGGAITHSHLIGASGAVLATRLKHSMKRDGRKRGIVTLCIGGGQGIALAIEML